MLSAQAAQRQGAVTHLAFSLLGRDGAIEFLNSPDEELGRRPIDLALESDEGLRSVEARLNKNQS